MQQRAHTRGWGDARLSAALATGGDHWQPPVRGSRSHASAWLAALQATTTTTATATHAELATLQLLPMMEDHIELETYTP